MTFCPRARRLARAALCALACAAAAPPAAAQSFLRGRVVRDGAGLPGAAVELHRVSRDTQGVVAAATSGAGGAFSFRLPPADGATGFHVVFATATHHGVRYFGPPMGPRSSDGYEVAVYDTTSARAAADSVRVARRDLFLLPDSAGEGWRAAEVVRLRNGSRRTLVVGDRPAFGVTLPAGAEGFEAGEGDSTRAGATTLAAMGDRAWVADPLLPGERDVFFRYRFPARASGASLSPAERTDTLYVYVPRGVQGVRVAGLLSASDVTIEGESFTRYGAGALPPHARIDVEWQTEGASGGGRTWIALGIAALIAAVGAVAMRRRRAAG